MQGLLTKILLELLTKFPWPTSDNGTCSGVIMWPKYRTLVIWKQLRKLLKKAVEYVQKLWQFLIKWLNRFTTENIQCINYVKSYCAVIKMKLFQYRWKSFFHECHCSCCVYDVMFIIRLKGHLLLCTVSVVNISESQYCGTQLFCDLFLFVVLSVARRNKQHPYLYLTLSFTTTSHVGGVRSEDHVL